MTIDAPQDVVPPQSRPGPVDPVLDVLPSLPDDLYDDVGVRHNEYVAHLLQAGWKEPNPADVVSAAVAFAKSRGDVPAELTDVVTESLLGQLRRQDYLRAIGDLGLGETLLLSLDRFRADVGWDLSEQNVVAARKALDEAAVSLRELERLQARLFGAVYQHSTSFWISYVPAAVSAQAYGASHVYTDWHAVGMADGSAAIGEAATWGIVAAAGWAAPPAGAVAVGVLIVSAAIASFMFYATGAAERPIEREPLTPGPGAPPRA